MECRDIAAVVTGGASGLGEGAARALAAAGCKIGGIFVHCDDLSRQRLGKPEEFGMMVDQMVRNPILNGEVIRLDCALRMAPR